MAMHQVEEPSATVGEARLRSDYCIFRRCGVTLAIATQVAREVLEPRPVTPVPRGPAELLGAFNLRGEVVPLVCLDRFLGLPEQPTARSETILVLGDGDLTVAAVVDEVTAIRHIAPWEIQRPDATDRERNTLVKGTIGREEPRTSILDGERLLSSIATHVATEFRRRSGGSELPTLDAGPVRSETEQGRVTQAVGRE